MENKTYSLSTPTNPLTKEKQLNNEQVKVVKVRERQWMYLGPIAATPFAHIAVTLYRNAKTTRQKQLVVGAGILGTSAITLGMRLYLMSHAGIGHDMHSEVARERLLEVTEDEKKQILHPTVGKIVGEALRGFG